eukprot:5366109-Prymnesium_polylepis.1
MVALARARHLVLSLAHDSRQGSFLLRQSSSRGDGSDPHKVQGQAHRRDGHLRRLLRCPTPKDLQECGQKALRAGGEEGTARAAHDVTQSQVPRS